MKPLTITGKVIQVYQVNVKESYGEIESAGVMVRSPALLAFVGQMVTVTIETA